MKKEKYYYIEYNKAIHNALIKLSIQHKVDTIMPDRPQLKFTLYDDQPYWEELRLILPRSNLDTLIFTPKEMREAPWFRMRSKCKRLDSMNDTVTFSFRCLEMRENINGTQYQIANHYTQVAPYEFKPIKWKPKNHFYSSYSGDFFTVFCDGRAKEVLETGGVQGVRFDPVIWYKKGCFLPDAHQIVPVGQIPRDALTIDEENTTRSECPFCHEERYDFNNVMRIIVKENVLNPACDFYATPQLFGWRLPVSMMVVSQKVYRILTEAELTRNLVFEPVVLI